MIIQCSLSIDREFGLLVGDGLLFTSLSAVRSLPRSGLCLRTAWICFSTSCTVPTEEPTMRPPSVSLHVSTHFAKAEVTSFGSLELVHLRHVKLLLQHFLHTYSKRRSATVHLVLSGPVPVMSRKACWSISGEKEPCHDDGHVRNYSEVHVQTKKVRRKASPLSESVGEGKGGNGRTTASGKGPVQTFKENQSSRTVSGISC